MLADTGLADSSLVVPFTWMDTSGRVVCSYWAVDFTLRGRYYLVQRMLTVSLEQYPFTGKRIDATFRVSVL